MSSMLEQAIIDAEALKEAAVKNAEQALIEKYSDQIKEAVHTLLEEDDLDKVEADAGLSEEESAEKVNDPSYKLPTKTLDGTNACPCPEAGEEIETELDIEYENPMSLNKAPTAASPAPSPAMANPMGTGMETTPLMENSIISLNLDKLEEYAIKMEEEHGKRIVENFQKSPDSAVLSVQLDEDEEYEDEDSSEDDEFELTEEELRLLEELGDDDEDGEEPTEDEDKETSDEEKDILEELMEELEADLEEVPRGSTDVGPPTPYQEELANDIAEIKEKLEEAEEENNDLKESLKHFKHHLDKVNTNNAKLLYMNKVLVNASLNERQKDKIVDAIARANSVKEAKVIFETLQDSVGSEQSSNPKSLNEAVSRRPSLFLKENRNTQREEANPQSNRWKKLAGIT